MYFFKPLLRIFSPSMLIINCIHRTEDCLFASSVCLHCLSVILQWEWNSQWQQNDLWVIVTWMAGTQIKKADKKRQNPNVCNTNQCCFFSVFWFFIVQCELKIQTTNSTSASISPSKRYVVLNTFLSHFLSKIWTEFLSHTKKENWISIS